MRVWRSSAGCGVAQQGAALLSRVQHSSGGCSVTQKSVAKLRRVRHFTAVNQLCMSQSGIRVSPVPLAIY